jgi:nucleoside-diphosphate kinase
MPEHKLEQTLIILKPDVVAVHRCGEIIARIEQHQLGIIGMKMLHLTTQQAKAFYHVHAHRPFFQELVVFMSEGPVVVLVVEGDNIITRSRTLIGATNPKEAAPGTIRADFAQSIDRNAIHGSDSLENAKIEIAFYFKPQEIFSRSKTP